MQRAAHTQFSLLVKPASADCNLRCEYCFYLGKCHLYPQSPRHRMPDAVLEQMIQSYLATDQDTYAFGWQGGEPTLMGLDFFRRVTDLQQKHGKPGASVANGLQTNATLIDDDLAEHFARYRFLLGCSLDGPPEMHDRYRKTATGAPSHAAVVRGIQTLKAHAVEFNILVLVSQANVHNPTDVYRYLVDQGFLYHQYIPCVEFEADGSPAPFSISAAEWGSFLCGIFDEWHRDDTRRVSIRHFDSILSLMVDNHVTVCTLGRNCCQYFVVEHSGDIYPCDFFVDPELRLGNVMTTTWQQALESPAYREFGKQKTHWNAACTTCRHLHICSGDCLKHRPGGAGGEPTLSHLCQGWLQFFDHTEARFAALARRVREQRVAAEAAHRQALHTGAQPTVGRNDPCPCGSGVKFKRCCGRK